MKMLKGKNQEGSGLRVSVISTDDLLQKREYMSRTKWTVGVRC